MSTTINTQNVGTSSAAATTTVPQGTLGKDDFLKLLISQLKNQDPLNPMNGTDFAAQLAQFSSLEQLTNINANLETSISANSVLSQSISNAMAATLIGKQVRATGTSFAYPGSGDVKLGYNLTAPAYDVTVKVYNSAGAVVRTIHGLDTDSGDQTFSWDGKDDAGNAVAAGKYTFKVSATDSAGSAMQATPFMFGTVSAVRYKSTGTVFVVDGIEIPLSDILEITNG